MNGNMHSLSILALAILGAQAAGTVNGASVDMRNFQGVGKFCLHSTQPAAGTTGDVKVQHSDDGAVWADAGITFPQVTNAANHGLQEIVTNADNLKRYVRGVSTVAGAGTFTHSLKFVGIKQR